jgi:hypothetical protein
MKVHPGGDAVLRSVETVCGHEPVAENLANSPQKNQMVVRCTAATTPREQHASIGCAPTLGMSVNGSAGRQQSFLGFQHNFLFNVIT